VTRFLLRRGVGSGVGFLTMKTLIILVASTLAVSAEWPAPKAPAIPEADGYVEIPNAAIAPTRSSTYRAVFDATRAADKAMPLFRR